MKNSNASSANQSSAICEQVERTNDRAPFNIALCISKLLACGAYGLTADEALSAYGETCLNDTISILQNDFGLQVDTKYLKKNSGNDLEANCARYSLNDFWSIREAEALIIPFMEQRGANHD